MKQLILVVCILANVVCNSLEAQEAFPVLKGPYLGQKPPDDVPILFAPRVISETGSMIHDTPIFSSEGTELYWPKTYSDRYASILYTRMTGNVWAEPKPLNFTSPDEIDGCPTLSPDGEILFFNSFRDLQKGEKSRRERIWYVRKVGNNWGKPQE